MLDLEQLEKAVKELEKVDYVHEGVSLFPDAFITSHTKFSSWLEMLAAGGVKKQSQLRTPAFTDLIAENSDFKDFDELYLAAAKQFVKKKARRR